MSGSTDLDYLLRAASPVLDDVEYVFVSRPGSYGDNPDWEPLAAIGEKEGMTFIVSRSIADRHRLDYDDAFRRITLQVHSSLSAVGLTAAFSACLADAGISANVIAAFYHDHIFVPSADAERAMTALAGLADHCP